MALAESYRKQVALLIRTVPFVAPEKEFALKGGMAINLFVREMPRLSVDIDLTYVPVADRATSLKAIDAGMRRIADAITKGMRGAQLNASQPKGETCTTKLILRLDDAQTKIEVTPVLRGCVYEPAVKRVSPKVEEQFGFGEMPFVNFADLYAARSWQLSIVSIREIYSTRATSWQMKPLTRCCARPSSFTCSATTGRWQSFSRRRG